MHLLKPAIAISLFIVTIAGAQNAFPATANPGGQPQTFNMCAGDEYGVEARRQTKFLIYESESSSDTVATIYYDDFHRRARIKAVGTGKAEVLITAGTLIDGRVDDRYPRYEFIYRITVFNCPVLEAKPQPERPDQSKPPVPIEQRENNRLNRP